MKFGKYQGKRTTSLLGELKEDGENKLPLSLSIKKVKPVYDGVSGRVTGYERTEVHIKKGRGKIDLLAAEVPRLIGLLQRVDAQLHPPPKPKRKTPRRRKKAAAKKTGRKR